MLCVYRNDIRSEAHRLEILEKCEDSREIDQRELSCWELGKKGWRPMKSSKLVWTSIEDSKVSGERNGMIGGKRWVYCLDGTVEF